MAKKKKAQDPGIPEWVVTYGDMMSLLLCFFILLAAFSELKQERDYQDVLKELREAFGYTGGMNSSPLRRDAPNSTISNLQKLDARSGQKDSRADSSDPNIVGKEQESQMIREGERWRLGAALPFGEGSSDVTPWSRDQLLNEIAPRIRDTRNIIRVVGHAWGVSDRSDGDPNDLAYQRAKAVAMLLINEGGVPAKSIRIVSAGESEPAALTDGGGGGGVGGGGAGDNRRVEVIQTGLTVDQVHPDPEFTGRAGVGGSAVDRW